MIALLDYTSYYASAECIFNPAWRQRPVCVTSGGGQIIAANKIALKAGVKKFQRVCEQQGLLDQIGAVITCCNFELYGQVSQQSMITVEAFASRSHQYSIDEIFLDFDTHKYITDWADYGQQIRRAVWQNHVLPSGIGFGWNLVGAKIANHAAKKLPGYQGIAVLDTHKELDKALKQMPVKDVWGIGPAITRSLSYMGIESALQLKNMKLSKARSININVAKIVTELNENQRCLDWDDFVAPKKQIFSTRSISERIYVEDDLAAALSRHAQSVAYKARKQGSKIKTVLFFARTSPYEKCPQHSSSHTVTFDYATSDTSHLLMALRASMPALFKPGVPFYKIGVGAVELEHDYGQKELFALPENNKLMEALDGLNKRFGRGTLSFASQGFQKTGETKRPVLSPQYLSNWAHLPRIRC